MPPAMSGNLANARFSFLFTPFRRTEPNKSTNEVSGHVSLSSLIKPVNTMQILSAFKLREIAGEHIVVNQGAPETDLTRIISLNTSARLLWKALSGKAFTVEEAAAILTEAYRIPQEQGLRDAARWVDSLKKCHLITD